MSKKSSALAAAGILAAAVVLSGFSIYKDSHQKNSTDGTITLRMAQTSSQAGAIGQSMEAFADRIYDETEGKYKIETYHNGQLGAEIDTIEGCQMGTIDIAVVNQSTIGTGVSLLAFEVYAFYIKSVARSFYSQLLLLWIPMRTKFPLCFLSAFFLMLFLIPFI